MSELVVAPELATLEDHFVDAIAEATPAYRRALGILLVQLLAGLAIASAACGGGDSAPAPSSTESTPTSAIATVPPGPSPESTPPGSTATASATQTPEIASTLAAGAWSPPPTVQQPMIAPKANSAAYDRDDWEHWIDADGDCQNTRAEVLIAESQSPVTFRGGSSCTVDTGTWVGPFTGETFTLASDVDVDHMVPLKNAHESGGWAWSAERKRDYANDMSNPQHLIAVQDNANQSKGAQGPEGWKPPDQTYWCRYAVDWIEIKVTWEITVTSAERAALEAMLDTCPGGSPLVSESASTPTATSTVTVTPAPATATATTTSMACGGATATIVGVDKASTPEVVTITGAGDLTGWFLISVRGNQRYDFPAGFVLTGDVEVLSATPAFADSATKLHWTGSNVWNNSSDDDGELYDCEGTLVSFWDD